MALQLPDALKASSTFWNDSCSLPPHSEVTTISPVAPELAAGALAAGALAGAEAAGADAAGAEAAGEAVPPPDPQALMAMADTATSAVSRRRTLLSMSMQFSSFMASTSSSSALLQVGTPCVPVRGVRCPDVPGPARSARRPPLWRASTSG